MAYGGIIAMPTFYHDKRAFMLNPNPINQNMENYTCIICTQFMEKPVTICSGENFKHRFCFDCIVKLTDKKCPTCRKGFEERHISEADIETKLTEGVRFFCPNKDENCAASLSLTDIKIGSHLNQCPEEMVECPNPECIQGSVNAGNGQSNTRSLSELVKAKQPTHTENHPFPAKRSDIDTQAGDPCQKTTKIKRKNIPEHLKSCAKFFTCECNETFPNITNQEYFKKYKEHILEIPRTHRQTIISNYLDKNRKQQTVLTDLTDLTEARPAVVGEINKPRVLNGIECFTTSSKYIFQCKKEPNDFILYFPAGSFQGETSIGTINYQTTHPKGDKIAASGNMVIEDYERNGVVHFSFKTTETIQAELKAFLGNMTNSTISAFSFESSSAHEIKYTTDVRLHPHDDFMIDEKKYHFFIFSL
nr:hypothetical protein [Endozoicomonas sp.]